MNIKEVPIDSIRASKWRSTYMLKPELKLLARSMVEYGWVSPIVVRKKDNTIIDGYYRWFIAQNEPEFKKRHGNKTVPVVFADVDTIDAMMMHIRLNRTRGQLMAKGVSHLVNDILRSRKYDRKDLKVLLTMTEDELNVLIDGSLLKHRKISEHEYSKAWIPVEVAAAIPVNTVSIETPPNSDR